MLGFWEVMDRCDRGPLHKEKQYDMQIARAARKQAEAFDIRFDPESVIPDDDDLADRLYRAALAFFVENGVYCRDTGRLVRFSRREVEEAVKNAPRSITYGQGRDTAVMTSRKVEDAKPPFITMTPVGTPVAEERFVAMMQSFVQEPLAQTFSSAFSQTVNGRAIKAGSPQETEAAIWNVIKLREAARRAGRPTIGIHNLVTNAEATDATLAAIQPAYGVLPNDGLGIAAISELKVDYERLKKVVFCRHSGHNVYGLYGPLLGGFAGGAETTAIIHVAHHFLGLLIYGAQWHCGFPLHLHYGCNSSRDLLWLIAVTSQALSRNTRTPISVSPFSAAGPCTDMVVQEMCAISIAATVSGANLLACAPARNRHPERGTGMEARICAEAGHLAARQGLTRAEANRVVTSLLSLYEEKLADAPLGLCFSECYDLDRLQPTREYVDLYDSFKAQAGDMGLDYSLL